MRRGINGLNSNNKRGSSSPEMQEVVPLDGSYSDVNTTHFETWNTTKTKHISLHLLLTVRLTLN